VADREDDDRNDSQAAAGPGVHRVARIADMSEAGTTVPVLSLQDIDAGRDQASVVDLRSCREEPQSSPVDRPDSNRPAARVIQIRTNGQGRRRRTGASRLESASPADPDDVPGSPDATGADATGPGSGSGARARRSGQSHSPSGRVAQRGGDQRPPISELEPDADPVAMAREICLRLLTDRARTRQELAQALRKRGVPDDAAGTVLERFDEVGLIDDAAFAGQWVRSRHARRGLARRAIAYELRRKGVAEEVAKEALTEVNANSEEQRARELVDHKLRTVPADTPDQRTAAARRLVGMLARKGYSGGIAYRVVREALAAKGADVDDELGGPDD
jgi:regulatory protein